MNSETDDIFLRIKELEKSEKKLYNKLYSSETPGEEKEQILQEIKNTVEMKLFLLNNLQDTNDNLQTSVENNKKMLINDNVNLDIIKKEIQNAQNQLDGLQDKKYNDLKMIEINKYFGDKYQAYANLMKLIIYVCIPLIIISIVAKTGLLGETIPGILTIVALSIAIVIVLWKLSDIKNRDNMNFDQYKWQFNPSSHDMSASPNVKGEGDWSSNFDLATCVGPQCCGKEMQYDSKENKCIEGMKSLGSDYLCREKKDDTIDLYNDNIMIMPFSFENGYNYSKA